MSVLHVVFKVDGAEYVLPAADVLQMESFTGATPVPGAAPHVAGLVQVRGRVIPVVDARLRFGLPAWSARWTPGWWWRSSATGSWGWWWTAPARC